MDIRTKPIKVNAKHRAFISAMRKHRQHLQLELEQSRIKYDTKRKQYYDRNRFPASKYQIGQEIYVDVSIGKVGNVAKLGVNRKHAVIIDSIGENSYTVKFDDGKISAVNVERIYTISKESNISNKSKSKRGKSAHKNFKKRAKKRKFSAMITDDIVQSNIDDTMDINESDNSNKRYRHD